MTRTAGGRVAIVTMDADPIPGTAARPLAFVHVPKAAGSTLHAILARRYPAERTLIFDLQRPDAGRMIAGLTAEQKERVQCLRGHMPYGIHRLIGRDAAYVTVLRDPVRRIVSKYRNLVRRPRRALELGLPPDRLRTLEDFLDLQVERNAMDFQTRLIAGRLDLDAPLAPYREPVPAEALKTALDNLERDFVVAGSVERFDETVILMKQAFGWGPVSYARRNVDPRRAADPGREIPEALAGRIRELNSLDVQLVAEVARRLEARIATAGEDFQADLARLRRTGRILYALQQVPRKLGAKRARDLVRRIGTRP